PPAQARTRKRPWDDALGGGAHDCLAASVPAPASALRTARGHPRGVPPHRMRANRVEGTRMVFLIGVLRRSSSRPSMIRGELAARRLDLVTTSPSGANEATS